MKKTIIGIFAIAIVVIAAALVKQQSPGADTPATSLLQPSNNSGGTTNPTGNVSAGNSSTANLSDGSYTGQAVDVHFGIVQVKATISGGKISDISFLSMPSEANRSYRLSAIAEPILKSETISAQSANVDIVSGATSTSEGYVQSLQTALSQAAKSSASNQTTTST